LGKRYVTIRDVVEMYDISERSLRRWIEEKKDEKGKDIPKVIQTITDVKGHIRMDLEEVEQVMKHRNIPPNPLYQQVQEHQSRLEDLERQVKRLREQFGELVGRWETSHPQLLAALANGSEASGETNTQATTLLKEQIAQLLAEMQRGHPKGKAKQGLEGKLQRRGFEDGTLMLVDFVEVHRVKLWDLKKLYWAGKIALQVRHREAEAKRNKQEWWVTPEQHSQISAYCQQHEIPYTPCRQCEPQEVESIQQG
jgi:hypothetical protein